MTAQLNSWISTKSGKWHRATVAEPTWAHEETSACGRTFTPRNVEWDRFPYGDDVVALTPPGVLALYMCQHCESK
jgi:hypothetical protein